MVCGVGSGKTFSGCLESVKTALEYPGTAGVIVASTYRNLKDFILPMIQTELWQRLGIDDGWDRIKAEFNKQDMIAVLKNGSRIYFRSCDRPDDLRGPNLGWFFIDEAAKVPYKAWSIMAGRIRITPERGWITTTPRGRNWVWEEFAKKNRRNYEWWTGATSENKHLSKEYVDSLLESYKGSFLAQEFYGEFVAWEGLVYPSVTLENCHLDAPEPKSGYKYAIAGTDWGWVDPSVLTIASVSTDGLLHLVDEFYQPKTPIEDIVDIAVERSKMWGIDTFHCDPSEPEYIEKFSNAGLDARKANNAINPGIAEVTRMVDSGLFKVDFNRCPSAVREFELYRYDEDDFGNVLKNRPIDADNHAMDAVRYLVYSHSKRTVWSTVREGTR
jgi:PBSX family phage terminase large subunit